MQNTKRPSLQAWKAPPSLMNKNYCGEAAVGMKEENKNEYK